MSDDDLKPNANGDAFTAQFAFTGDKIKVGKDTFIRHCDLAAAGSEKTGLQVNVEGEFCPDCKIELVRKDSRVEVVGYGNEILYGNLTPCAKHLELVAPKKLPTSMGFVVEGEEDQ